MQTLERRYHIGNRDSALIELGKVSDSLPRTLITPFVDRQNTKDWLRSPNDKERLPFLKKRNVLLGILPQVL
jgi:hypothetical protein